MAVTTKLTVAGLARDAAPEVSAQSGALRRAENVVLRSAGVIETRPSFPLLYENTSTTRRITSLYDFLGRTVAIERDFISGAWTGSLNGVLLAEPPHTAPNVLGPPSYDLAETKYAEARGTLYFTGQRAIVALDSATNTGTRLAGVEMVITADVARTDEIDLGTLPPASPDSSFAYRFVFVKTNANGYVRRSPPSQRYIVRTISQLPGWGVASRVYLPSSIVAGDVLEAYRTRTVLGDTPRPEHFLAFSYTVTSSDISAGYCTPPLDVVPDSQLGAQLYTDAAVGGIQASKYRPPASGIVRQWLQRMWFAQSTDRQRVEATLVNIGRSGLPIAVVLGTGGGGGMFTAGSAVVTCPSTAGLQVGMYVTTNPSYGIGFDSYFIPANTVITALTSTTFTMSANALQTSGGATYVYAFRKNTPQGLIAETAKGSFVSGVAQVTGVTNVTDDPNGTGGDAGTNGWRTGMMLSGAGIPVGAKILTIDSTTSFTMDQPATLTTGANSPFTIGDAVTVSTGSVSLSIMATRSTTAVAIQSGAAVGLTPWTSAVPTFLIGSQVAWKNTANVGPPTVGPWQVGLALQSLCETINYYALHTPNLYRFRANLGGDAWSLRTQTPGDSYLTMNYDAAGLVAPPGTLATTMTIEAGSSQGERQLDTDLLTFSCTRPEAWSPSTTITATISPAPSRVYFSDPDEPESVPLLNFTDVGDKTQPVLALVPLRNALLVFKTDGLYRITGSPPSLAADPLDPSIRLIRSECVAQMDNVAYAWTDRGVFACTETGIQSISANHIDVELRKVSDTIFAPSLIPGTAHGTFVVPWRTRNMVLLGVPNANSFSYTATVYAYCAVTSQWSEWPVQWVTACEVRNATNEPHGGTVVVARAPVGLCVYETRYGTDSNGIDRTYALGPSITVTGTTITVSASDIGTWNPVVGDWISGTNGTTRYYRRITAAVLSMGVWTFTLEAEITAGGGLIIDDTGDFFITDTGFHIRVGDLNTWQAHEAVNVTLEWHPTSPAGIPIGTLARELQFQMDLRDAPNPAVTDTIPKYVAGGTSDRNAFATVTSNMARIAQIQPLRLGVSRQVARSATFAPYLQTGDLYPIRVVGASAVFEGTSEKSRR